MLIPIRLFTLPSPLRDAPLLTGASVRKSCTDTSGLHTSWKNGIPVFDIVTSLNNYTSWQDIVFVLGEELHLLNFFFFPK